MPPLSGSLAREIAERGGSAQRRRDHAVCSTVAADVEEDDQERTRVRARRVATVMTLFLQDLLGCISADRTPKILPETNVNLSVRTLRRTALGRPGGLHNR